MLKKLYIISATIFAVALLTVTAYADTQMYVGGYNGVKTSAVEFDFEQSQLEAGDRVSASIRAVKPEGDAVNALFMLAVYDNKKLVSISVDNDTKMISSVEAEFIASGVIPESENPDYAIKAMLINPEDFFAPVSNPAYYPLEEEFLPLKEIRVAGKVIEDFNPDVYSYEYIIGRENEAYPQIEAVASDGGVKIDVSFEGSFPGSSVITATAYGGKTKTYTINFEYLSHAVKGAMKNSDFVDDPGVTDGKMSLSDVLTKSVGNHENRNKLFTNLHGEDKVNGIPGSRYVVDYDPNVAQYYNISSVADDLIGCDYFITKRDNVPTEGDLYEFELGAKAEVVILSTEKVSNLTDYTESGNGTDAIAMISYANSKFIAMFAPYDIVPTYSDVLLWNGKANVESARPYLAQKYNIPVEELNWTGNWATSNIMYTYRYSKVYDAGETVTIPASQEAIRGYIVVIKVL